MNPIIEISFGLNAEAIPVDHGYHLYSALSHFCPFLHETNNLAITLIRGQFIGQGLLKLLPSSRLTLRITLADLSQILILAGKKIYIAEYPLRLGVPNTTALIPASALYSHLVTTKHGEDETRFDEEMQHQLHVLGIKGQYQRGSRRTFKVKNKQVVAHSVMINELTAEESLRLQEYGLGGRRKMGCGFFVVRNY